MTVRTGQGGLNSHLPQRGSRPPLKPLQIKGVPVARFVASLSQVLSRVCHNFQNLPDAPVNRGGHSSSNNFLLHGGYRFGNLEAVRIISKAAITEFSKTHPDALEPLLHWHSITKRAAWRHLADVRADFPHANALGTFTVFNIRGNKYRLISVIKYRWQIVYIRHILTHAEYDKGKWKL